MNRGKKKDSRPLCCKAFRDGECRDKNKCALYYEIKNKPRPEATK